MTARVESPRLYLVTDSGLCGGARGVLKTVSAAARNGIDIVQLRDHDASTRDVSAMATELIDVCRPLGVPVVIDDRLDVALAVGAAGVHLGQTDLDPVAARRLADACAGPDFHIGWSVSTVAEAEAARRFDDGVIDLVGIGPFRATPTKPDASSPLGPDGLRAVLGVVRDSGLDTIVIGGIREPDVADLLCAGADGVAVVSAICGQPDPARATRALRRAVDAHVGGAGVHPRQVVREASA